MTPYGPAWYEELSLLVDALPPRIAEAARRLPDEYGELLEIVLDLGREPEARFDHGEQILDSLQVTAEDIDYVTARVGAFGDDNRAGIERTLHRISAIRNRGGRVVGLTLRVGRAVTGTIDIIKDIVVSGKSILLLGAPGIGKTTMLRECARVLSDECRKRVVIVDTSNEIAGDGDIPHPGIGRARRMQVRTPMLQHAVMIEAVENHMPEVIVIDEIGTELEAAAARTIAERGVQLIATAHGQTLENLLVNPTLNDLLGGIQSVTLSDEEARRRGTQKSVLERKAPPTFDVLVEIQDRDRVAIHMPLSDVVDSALRGDLPAPRIRLRTRDGRVLSNVEEDHREAPPEGAGNGRLAAPGPAPSASTKKPRNVFAYGVSRSYIEHAARDLDLPLRILGHPEGADLVLTLKNHYRKRPDSIRQAGTSGIPIVSLRSNTVTQVKEALATLYAGELGGDPTSKALDQARDAINRVKTTLRPLELSPQNAYVRRLQHQLVDENGVEAKSTGKEPQRRLRIFPAGME